MVRRLLFYMVLLPGLSFSQELDMEVPLRYLALGDSYTIGESVSEDMRWPVQLKDSLKARGYEVDTLTIIATTGWTTTDLLNGVADKNPSEENYNLVSLLIGVNNQYQGKDVSVQRKEFQQLLDSAIACAGGDTNRVFVVSIPDYAYTPFGKQDEKISSEIDAYNQLNRSITESYGITYIDITPISRLPRKALVAKDGLHPSGYQYGLWVEEILGILLSESKNSH